MNPIIEKRLKEIGSKDELNISIYRKDIEDELYEVCETEHAGCNDMCPVYAKRRQEKGFDMHNFTCPYFRNGKAMLNYLQEKIE